MSRRLGERFGQTLSVTGIDKQAYDPELAAIEPGASLITRRRLASGYGAPPVIPYGQTVRKRLLTTFPALNSFPRVKKLLEM